MKIRDERKKFLARLNDKTRRAQPKVAQPPKAAVVRARWSEGQLETAARLSLERHFV